MAVVKNFQTATDAMKTAVAPRPATVSGTCSHEVSVAAWPLDRY